MYSRNKHLLSILIFIIACIALYFVLFTPYIFNNTFILSNKNIPVQELSVTDNEYVKSNISEIEKENFQLKQLLSFKNEHTYSILSAPVIARDIDLYNALTIGVGQNENVSIGDIVIVGKGTVIGTIISVAQFRSTVLLLNDPALSLTVKKLGTTEPIGITKGLLGAGMSIDLIPKDSILSVGDVIVTTSDDASIPQGLIIGTISRLYESDNQLFNQASVTQLVDAYQYSIVGIIKKP